MRPELYSAAESGDIFIIEQYKNLVHTEQTPIGNTALHVVAQFCDSSLAVERILAINPHLLLKLNIYRQTPLHIASRKGHFNVVQALVDFAKRRKFRCKRMLRSRDDIGNLPLHEAVHTNCPNIVKLLVQEDPEFSHGGNRAKESPLYLSVEKGFHNLADLILSTCRSRIAYGGPQQRTALHAAVVRNSLECTKMILEKLPCLAKKVDIFGWTPLHYAARLNHHEIVGYLLHVDRSMAYTTAKHGAGMKTALLVAAAHGHTQVIEEILSYCPDSWEMATRLGRNLIHLAVEKEQKDVLDFTLEKSWASDLINQKDANGNTPLHLYAATKYLQGAKLVNHPEVDRNAINNDGLTPLDIVNGNEADMDRKTLIKAELEGAGASPGLRNVVTYLQEPGRNDPEILARMAETYLIVATLIITVTFAAAFTVPGGYETKDGPGKGTVVLAKRAAFIAFIVFDFSAMILSVISVFRLLSSHLSRKSSVQLNELDGCRKLIGWALSAIVISSVTGLYAVVRSMGIRIILFLLSAAVCPTIIAYFRWPGFQPKAIIRAKRNPHARPYRVIFGFRFFFWSTNED